MTSTTSLECGESLLFEDFLCNETLPDFTEDDAITEELRGCTGERSSARSKIIRRGDERRDVEGREGLDVGQDDEYGQSRHDEFHMEFMRLPAAAVVEGEEDSASILEDEGSTQISLVTKRSRPPSRTLMSQSRNVNSKSPFVSIFDVWREKEKVEGGSEYTTTPSPPAFYRRDLCKTPIPKGLTRAGFNDGNCGELSFADTVAVATEKYLTPSADRNPMEVSSAALASPTFIFRTTGRGNSNNNDDDGGENRGIRGNILGEEDELSAFSLLRDKDEAKDTIATTIGSSSFSFVKPDSDGTSHPLDDSISFHFDYEKKSRVRLLSRSSASPTSMTGSLSPMKRKRNVDLTGEGRARTSSFVVFRPRTMCKDRNNGSFSSASSSSFSSPSSLQKIKRSSSFVSTNNEDSDDNKCDEDDDDDDGENEERDGGESMGGVKKFRSVPPPSSSGAILHCVRPQSRGSDRAKRLVRLQPSPLRRTRKVAKVRTLNESVADAFDGDTKTSEGDEGPDRFDSIAKMDATKECRRSLAKTSAKHILSVSENNGDDTKRGNENDDDEGRLRSRIVVVGGESPNKSSTVQIVTRPSRSLTRPWHSRKTAFRHCVTHLTMKKTTTTTTTSAPTTTTTLTPNGVDAGSTNVEGARSISRSITNLPTKLTIPRHHSRRPKALYCSAPPRSPSPFMSLHEINERVNSPSMQDDNTDVSVFFGRDGQEDRVTSARCVTPSTTTTTTSSSNIQPFHTNASGGSFTVVSQSQANMLEREMRVIRGSRRCRTQIGGNIRVVSSPQTRSTRGTVSLPTSPH
eukprot:g4952.t1